MQTPSDSPAPPRSPFAAGIALADLGFAWPAPALPGFPLAVKLALAPCQIEGLNGAVTSGRLVDLHAAKRQIHVVARGARSAVCLQFDQFVRLRLDEELHRPATADADALPLQRYRLHMKRGDLRHGDLVAHLEVDSGLFLFEPADATGSRLRRSFLPRSAYLHFELASAKPAPSAGPQGPQGPQGQLGQLGQQGSEGPQGQPSSACSTQARGGFDAGSTGGDMTATISGVRLQPGLMSMAQMARQLHAVAQQAHAQGMAAAVIEQCRRSAAKSGSEG
jgi:hypothetical protein